MQCFVYKYQAYQKSFLFFTHYALTVLCKYGIMITDEHLFTPFHHIENINIERKCAQGGNCYGSKNG